MKQARSQFSIQCVFAVGPYSILTLQGESSPFSINAMAVHFFSEGEVTGLLQQFAQSSGIVVDPAVARDVFKLTSGHAGLVCACGRALESVGELRSICPVDDSGSPADTSAFSMLRPRIQISLESWLRWRVLHIDSRVSSWPTVQHMADSAMKLPALAQAILVRAILADDAPIVVEATAPQSYVDAVRLLAGEGWLKPLGALDSKHRFVFTSPLVRTVAMNKLAAMRSRCFPSRFHFHHLALSTSQL